MTITSRPILPVYVEADKNELPDKVIIITTPTSFTYNLSFFEHLTVTATKITYNCWYKWNKNNANTWKIEVIIEYIAVEGTRIESVCVYPWGCKGYNFDPADIASYSYSVRY